MPAMNTAPMLADHAATQLALRVEAYNRDLRDFQRLQLYFHQPSVNADRQPELWARHERLRVLLKSESDALWNLGVNVYTC